MKCHGCKTDVPFTELTSVGEPYMSVRMDCNMHPIQVKRQTELCPKCLDVRLKFEASMGN